MDTLDLSLVPLEWDIERLRRIREKVDEDPSWLAGADCPIDGEVAEFLRELFTPRPTVRAATVPRRMGFDELEDELGRLWADVEEYGEKLDAADQAQKMQYFNTKFKLVEKIMDLQAQIRGYREVEQFQRRIVAILETVCDSAQRTEIMRILQQENG